MMPGFEPSPDFVARTMNRVRSHERALEEKRDRLSALLLSKQVRFALTVGAAALGIINLIRIASTLISPAVCR